MKEQKDIKEKRQKRRKFRNYEAGYLVRQPKNRHITKLIFYDFYHSTYVVTDKLPNQKLDF